MELTPSQDQIMGQLRLLLPSVGMLLAALGWGTAAENATLVTTILQAAGPLMILGGMIWQIIASTRKSILQSATKNLETAPAAEKAVMVKAVADLPEVKGVALDPSQPGVNVINAATPENVQV